MKVKIPCNCGCHKGENINHMFPCCENGEIEVDVKDVKRYMNINVNMILLDEETEKSSMDITCKIENMSSMEVFKALKSVVEDVTKKLK